MAGPGSRSPRPLSARSPQAERPRHVRFALDTPGAPCKTFISDANQGRHPRASNALRTVCTTPAGRSSLMTRTTFQPNAFSFGPVRRSLTYWVRSVRCWSPSYSTRHQELLPAHIESAHEAAALVDHDDLCAGPRPRRSRQRVPPMRPLQDGPPMSALPRLAGTPHAGSGDSAQPVHAWSYGRRRQRPGRRRHPLQLGMTSAAAPGFHSSFTTRALYTRHADLAVLNVDLASPETRKPPIPWELGVSACTATARPGCR